MINYTTKLRIIERLFALTDGFERLIAGSNGIPLVQTGGNEVQSLWDEHRKEFLLKNLMNL